MLEIIPGPGGGVIEIPGNESPSIHSSQKLGEEMQKRGYYGTTISVEKALEVVPGARIVFVKNSGGGRGVLMRFFKFPVEPAKSGSCVVW